ncbi:MAG: hypothetical protein CM1200mP14_03530 [Gammaproteobacteria bacterium]|nr:MAG: hypothetical protein CM1200mP14_03530 [Gammaproteobacteria bacterium]
MILKTTALALTSLLLSSCTIGNTQYDLVIEGGRVIDPESGLDAVRTIGVIGGEIAAITETSLEGDRVIQATGLVVVPGFIDLHEHGQEEDSYRMMVRDGVTTALELEVGTADVEGWYAEREGGKASKPWREHRPIFVCGWMFWVIQGTFFLLVLEEVLQLQNNSLMKLNEISVKESCRVQWLSVSEALIHRAPRWEKSSVCSGWQERMG